MRPYQILLCAVLGAPLVACGEAYPQTVIKTKDGKVVIQLKDAGAEPRKRLHYQLEEGQAAKMDIEMEMAMRQKVHGRTNTMAPMKMAMRMAFGAATRTDDGNLRLDFSLEKVDMGALGNAPGAAERLEQLEQLSGWVVMTPHGCAVDMGIDLPDGLPDGMAQFNAEIKKSFSQMPMIFPEQPIGVGAEWEIAMPMSMYGMTLEQTLAYKLVELDGTRGKLEISIEQKASGKMKPPGMPPSVEANIDFLKSEGSGTMEFDLNSFVPTAEMKLKMDMKMSISMDGEEDEAVEMGIDLDLSMRPVPVK